MHGGFFCFLYWEEMNQPGNEVSRVDYSSMASAMGFCVTSSYVYAGVKECRLNRSTETSTNYRDILELLKFYKKSLQIDNRVWNISIK